MITTLRRATLALLLILVCQASMASTYFVDGAAGNDGNSGTSAGAGNAWATLGHAASTVVSGDTVNVKASATYSELLTLTTNGAVNAPITWVGYTTTVGDNGRVIVEGGNARASCLDLAACTFNIFRNFTFQGSTAQVIAWTGTAELRFYNCRILKGSGTAPVSFQPSAGFAWPFAWLVGCEVANFAGAGITNITPRSIVLCDIHGNGGVGVAIGSFKGLGNLSWNRIYANTGHGVSIPSNSGINTGDGHQIAFNTIYGNGGDGLNIDGAVNGTCLILNNIIAGNTGWAMRCPSAPSTDTVLMTASNFFWNNTAGEISLVTRFTPFVANVSLSGDPFVSAATGNFALNSTAGAGASVRAAAWPSAGPAGATSIYQDGGSSQHQDSGGGGGTTGRRRIQ